MRSLRDAAVDRLATQWTALGGQLASRSERSVVDPEALLVATSRLGGADPRVYEVAVAWCVAFGSVINVSRLRRVASELDGAASLGVLAASVRAAGGPGWPFAGIPLITSARRKIVVRDLVAPARLVWRLRAAFGVNARADLMAVLLVTPWPRSIADLATATRFGKRNVAGAVADMALAGIVETERVGKQDRVRLAPDAPIHAWRPPRTDEGIIDWASRWRVILATIAVDERTREASPTARLVETRTSVEALRSDIIAGCLPRPDVTSAGSGFADAYQRWTADIAELIG